MRQTARDTEMGKPQSTVRELDFSVPAKVSKYQLLDRIGSGTCGIVYRAYDAILSRDVAIKLSEVQAPDAKTGRMPGAQRAFVTETLSAGRLSHPNIVSVYDAGVDGPLNYIVMEYVEGVSLKQYGKGKQQLPPHRVIQIITEVCEAIDFSHQMGIVHRDIKPANIMVSTSGDVKLLDFGIAINTSAEDAGENGRPSLGTPNYMSPEQITGKELGPRSDIYSLGTVLFEMLTGQQLFRASKVRELFRAVVHDVAPPLRTIREDLPPELERILARALAKHPQHRFASGAEMAQALRDVAEKIAPPDLLSPELSTWMPIVNQLKFFQGFSARKITRFVSLCTLARFEGGSTALGRDTLDNHLYVILEGIASLQDHSGLGAVLGPGDCFGEGGFVRGDKNPVQIDAMTDVVALKVRSSDVHELSPAEQLGYYQMIANHLSQKTTPAADELLLDLAL